MQPAIGPAPAEGNSPSRRTQYVTNTNRFEQAVRRVMWDTRFNARVRRAFALSARRPAGGRGDCVCVRARVCTTRPCGMISATTLEGKYILLSHEVMPLHDTHTLQCDETNSKWAHSRTTRIALRSKNNTYWQQFAHCASFLNLATIFRAWPEFCALTMINFKFAKIAPALSFCVFFWRDPAAPKSRHRAVVTQ